MRSFITFTCVVRQKAEKKGRSVVEVSKTLFLSSYNGEPRDCMVSFANLHQCCPAPPSLDSAAPLSNTSSMGD